MHELLKKTGDDLSYRNYSKRTIQSYVRCLRAYFIFKKTDFSRPDRQNIVDFLLYKQNQGASGQTLNVYMQAIKFFYREVVGINVKVNIRISKKRKRLAVVLSREEIKQVLKVVQNPKHHLLLATAYGAGLRVSEAVGLRVKDVCLNELTIIIRNGKGNKDRITVFPGSVKIKMAGWISGRPANDLVFESPRGGGLSTRTAQAIFKQACQKAGIKKDATFHSLRHSFATHLIEDGVGLRYVQELLGHQNIRTTEAYVKVTNPGLKKIKSPL